ncbi:MAG: 50S ribosomal protein L4 [Candidatus Buchananbacteria bacterium]
MQVKVYNQQGKEVGTRELPKEIFAVPVKESVVHQVVTAILANLREPWAHTKTKGEVRGGGKKPWKQKGTGRARHGSSRSPIWKGGGVTFGPRNDRNYKQKVNKKVKSLALRMVLSDKALAEKITVLEDLVLTSVKTKELAKVLKTLKLNNVLIILDKKNDEVKLSAKNLPKTSVVSAKSLNILEMLKRTNLIITNAAVEQLVETYGKKIK